MGGFVAQQQMGGGGGGGGGGAWGMQHSIQQQHLMQQQQLQQQQMMMNRQLQQQQQQQQHFQQSSGFGPNQGFGQLNYAREQQHSSQQFDEFFGDERRDDDVFVNRGAFSEERVKSFSDERSFGRDYDGDNDRDRTFGHNRGEEHDHDRIRRRDSDNDNDFDEGYRRARGPLHENNFRGFTDDVAYDNVRKFKKQRDRRKRVGLIKKKRRKSMCRSSSLQTHFHTTTTSLTLAIDVFKGFFTDTRR